MVFRAGFILAVALPVGLGLVVADRLFVKPPVAPLIPGFIESCTRPQDVPMRDFVCIASAFIRAMVADPLARLGAFSLVALFVPLLFWQFEQGIKPGRSVLFHPWVTIALALVGQMAGIGVVAAIIVPPLYAAVKTFEPASHRPLPPHNNAGFTRLSLFLHAIVLAIAFIVVVVPQNSGYLDLVSYTFQAYPFFFLPLVFFGPKSASVSSSQASSANAFDSLGLFFFPVWVVTVAGVLYALLIQGFPPDNVIAQLFAWDVLGVVAGLVGIYVVDLAAGDTIASPNPLFGSLIYGPPSAFSRYFAEKERQAGRKAPDTKKAA